MHFFIRRQTNGQTWRGRANQNPMRQQRPPIKRSLLKLPVTNPRSCSAIGQFDIGPRAGPVPYVYTSNIHIYTQGLRARGPCFPCPRRSSLTWTGPPFLSPFSRLPFKIWNAVTAKSAGSSYNAVELRATPRERKPVNWKRDDRVTGYEPPHVALSLRIPW